MTHKKIPISIQAEDDSLIPRYETELASGADLRAALSEPKILEPGAYALVPTGVKLEIPPGYEVQIRPRSGLAAKHGVTVLNTPGTIDADYRGEIRVILINLGKETFTILPAMRIAQLVVAPVIQAQFFSQKEALAATARGEGGFGHTGTN